MPGRSTCSAYVLAAVAAFAAMAPASVAAKPPSDVPGAEPYLSMTILGPYHGSVGDWSAVPIPADRRLVIEYVGVRTTVPVGELPLVAVYGRTLATWAPIIVPLTLAHRGSFYDDYRGNERVRLYFEGDGLHGPNFTCSSTGGSNLSYCDVTISGYLIGK